MLLKRTLFSLKAKEFILVWGGGVTFPRKNPGN